MPEIIEVEFHSKYLSDFQLSRLVQASLQKYTVTITAFISDVVIIEDACLGVSFEHFPHDDAYRTANGGIIRTEKIQRAWKEGRFWLLEAREGNYLIGSFKRGGGRRSFLELLRSGDRLVSDPRSNASSLWMRRHDSMAMEERWAATRDAPINLLRGGRKS